MLMRRNRGPLLPQFWGTGIALIHEETDQGCSHNRLVMGGGIPRAVAGHGPQSITGPEISVFSRRRCAGVPGMYSLVVSSRG